MKHMHFALLTMLLTSVSFCSLAAMIPTGAAAVNVATPMGYSQAFTGTQNRIDEKVSTDRSADFPTTSLSRHKSMHGTAVVYQ